MRCPYCGAGETRVIDSRLAAQGDQVRRRRECVGCQERFTTFESAELNLPRVVKRDGSREAFSDEKLRTGFTRALEKRPVATEDVDAAIARIRRRVMASGERELASKRIGEMVMHALRALDQVAWLRFASVYLSFDDLRAFREAIERLETEPPPEMRKQQLPLIPDDGADDEPGSRG